MYVLRKITAVNMLRHLLICSIFTAFIAISCNQFVPDLPPPSAIIEGNYIADMFVSREGITAYYPINSNTMTLTLKSISDDSVSVEIGAAPNGKFSPGSNRYFKAVYVTQEIENQIINGRLVNCITYRLGLQKDLSGREEYIRMRCNTGGTFDYYFTPPNEKNQMSATFVKR